jgi:hypothetical protein
MFNCVFKIKSEPLFKQDIQKTKIDYGLFFPGKPNVELVAGYG